MRAALKSLKKSPSRNGGIMRGIIKTTAIGAVMVIGAHAQDGRALVLPIVHKIQQADYAGDRAALKELAGELKPFVESRELGSRVLYWRGFALWRRAMNGAAKTDKREMEDDLIQAAADFREAADRDPGFVEARATEAFCVVNVSALNIGTERARTLFLPAMKRFNDALKDAPDNPRILWMHGANQFYQPPELGGGKTLALATYQRGLDLARKEKHAASDTLEPTWGEAELLMSLAFANLHQVKPDLPAARDYAEKALRLVPSWHYVRDVLLVQIQKAQSR
jgi:tetratricopeptide (TPR) repeat protein